MKRILVIFIFCFVSLTGYAQEGTFIAHDTEWVGSGSHIPSDYPILTISDMHVLTFGNEEGQEAILDFNGDKIVYSGDMPVDESAKLFFNGVLKLYKDMGCEE